MEGRAARRLGVALLALVLCSSQASVARAASAPTDWVHLLVQFAAGTSDVDRAAIVRDLGGRIEGEIRPLGVTRVAFPVERGSDPAAVVRAVATNRKITTAEQDARVHLDWTPNDPYWDTDPFVGLGEWGAKKVMLAGALDLVASLQPVTVAVIDTGVDAEHPDLSGVVLPGTTILSSQSTGCAADAIGTDDNSHGTHVAGIIAADANNAIGIAGIAPNARILPIKALDCTGSGSLADIAQAITYAVDHGARVINISLGASTDSATLESAVQYAVRHNVLIVAAVGNCGLISSRCLDTENLVEYPGASSGVLGVAATAPDDSIASFSTRGAQVGISAPGVRILSTTPHYPTFQTRHGSTMNYAAFSGTSQATPFVAGAAALLLGIDTSLTASGVADRLKTTADDLGPSGVDPAFGAGRMNLARAVVASLPAFSAAYDTSFVPRWVTTGTSFVTKVAITNTSRSTWSSSGGTPVELSYHWLDASGNVVVPDGIRTRLPRDVPPGTTVTVDLSVLVPPSVGTHVLRVDLYREGIGWFSLRGARPADVEVTIEAPHAAAYVPLTANVWLTLPSAAPLVVTLKNTGTTAWEAGGPNPVRLSYHWMRNGQLDVWDGARAAFASDVQPGETVIVELPVIPPEGIGARTLRLDLVEEGVRWFSDDGVATRDVSYTVASGYGAAYAPAVADPTAVAGPPASLTVTLTNTGHRPWAAGGAHPVRLSYHWLSAGAIVMWDGARASLGADVQPGESVTVRLPVSAPAAAGAFTLRLDLVEEGSHWFSEDGVASRDIGYLVTTKD